MSLYLSRLTISRTPSANALKYLIAPDAPGPRMEAHHRLIWSAFADTPDRTRDFLWRYEGDGRFITLSERPPLHADLFDPPEVKPFSPDLRAGDRLSFVLRANATRTIKSEDIAPSGKRRRKHRDVVMQLLHDVPGLKDLPEEEFSHRAPIRQTLAEQAAADWMTRQGDKTGFRVIDLHVPHYDAVVLPGHQGKRKKAPRLGRLDLTGILEVAEPEIFLAGLTQGFGRAKAFGCGLMLIARA